MPYDQPKTYQTIRAKPVTPAIGAEIEGVDLSGPLDRRTVDEIHDALMQYLVVFFRDQDITPRQHVAFAQHYGHVPKAQRAAFGVIEDAPEISVLENDEERPPNVNHYHTDGLYRAKPEFASVLHAKDVPPAGGDTIFVSMYAAYEALSDRMQRYVSGLTATHDFMKLHGSPAKARSWQGDNAERMDVMRKANPPVSHPLVRTHPVTGRKGLYLSESFTTYIDGMSVTESKGLLDLLFAHVRTPEFQCRFRWEKHSLAFWDNRPTQHYALADYWPQRRLMYRVSIRKDETPV